MPKNEEIRARLKWLMGLRVMIVALILGSSLIFQIGSGKLPDKSTFYLLILIISFLTIGYSIFISRFKWLGVFAYLQIILDISLESILIYLTGGIDSPFSFLYLISIISASMILYNKGAFIIASLCSILYGSIVDLQYYKIAPFIMESSLSASETMYILFLNVVSFFTVGGLSAHLAEKLRSTGEELREKDIGLTELQTFHENIVKSMSSGLVTTDLEGKINLFNKAAEEITGYSWDEVRWKRLYQVVDWKEIREIFFNENNLNSSFRFDREAVKKDNTKIQVGMTISPLKNKEGEITGIIAVFHDLTMIKEMEEEMGKKERLATIGEMAAGMAHEIRNPLASISGSIQILSQELITDDENRRLMEIALKETDRLNSIITEFLLYARPTPLNKERTDINELLLEIIEMIKREIDIKENIEVSFNPEKKSLYADIDYKQIKQVFYHLSINAIQAMPHRGRLIIKSCCKNSEIDISFIDTGEGIKKEIKEKIFYPFFTTRDRGSGLGLALVHRIIEEHNGKIEVESEEGNGTRFSVLLPMGK